MPPRKRVSAKSSRASSAVPLDSEVETVQNTGTNSPATSLEEEAKDATYDPAKETEVQEGGAQKDSAKPAASVRSTFIHSTDRPRKGDVKRKEADQNRERVGWSDQDPQGCLQGHGFQGTSNERDLISLFGETRRELITIVRHRRLQST